MKYTRTTKGFTLVELLVVIAIIALLLSILMPALSRVREQARAVVCKKNLNGIGFAFIFFKEDNGKFPCQQAEYYNNYWTTLIGRYIDPTNKKLFCPSNKKPFVFWEFDAGLPDEKRKKLTYTINTWTGLIQTKNEMSSKLVLLADGTVFQVWGYAHINYTKPVWYRLNPIHQNGSLNLLFYDNHVETVRKNKLDWRSFNPAKDWADPWNTWEQR